MGFFKQLSIDEHNEGRSLWFEASESVWVAGMGWCRFLHYENRRPDRCAVVREGITYAGLSTTKVFKESEINGQTGSL